MGKVQNTEIGYVNVVNIMFYFSLCIYIVTFLITYVLIFLNAELSHE